LFKEQVGGNVKRCCDFFSKRQERRIFKEAPVLDDFGIPEKVTPTGNIRKREVSGQEYIRTVQ